MGNLDPVRLIISHLACLCLAWLLAQPALATPAYNSQEYWQQRQAREDEARTKTEEARQAVLAARAELEQLAPGTITAQQANDYYRLALKWIRCQLEGDVICRYGMPLAIDDLVNFKDSKYWPADPLHDWKPLPVCEPGGGCAPGTVVYQRCPPEYYSLTRYSGSRAWADALSFELSICGAGERDASQPPPVAVNSAWAVLPANTLATSGNCEPPLVESLEPWEDAKSYLDGVRQQDTDERAALAYFRANIVLPEDNPNLHVDIALSVLEIGLAQARRCQELEPQLRAASSLAEQHGALKEYLYGNLWQVSEAADAHEWIYGTICWDIPTLVEEKLLTATPLNPLNGWQPLRILTLENGYQPGELCLQLPSTCWFGGLRGGIGPESHVLSIYGDSPDTRYANEAALSFGYNMDWAVLPEGTLEILSGFTQTQLQTDYRRAKCNI